MASENVIGNAFIKVAPLTDTFTQEATGGLSGLKKMLGTLGVPKELLSDTALTSAGLVAAAAAAAKLGSSMQDADARIAAVTGQSLAAAKALGNAFLTTGGASTYSAQTIAQAYSAVAGQLDLTNGKVLTITQSMAFMDAAQKLATASGQDLGDTTSTLATVLQAFQLSVSNTAKVSDILFNASNATGQSIDTIATSLQNVRSRLGETSPSLAQLTSLVVDMTKNGITGRAALTGLNTAMTALVGAATGTTKANMLAKQMLSDYGIAAEGANGKLVSMATIIDTLGPKYATMTKDQQLQTSTLIFGASAAKQMTQVIDGGIASYNAASDAVNKHNTVETAAQKISQTLSDQWAVAKVAVEDLGTSLGQVLVPAISDAVKEIVPAIDEGVKFVDWMEKGSGPAKALASVIGVLLLPKIVAIGVEATTAAARAVIAAAKDAASFVLIGSSAETNAAKTVTAMDLEATTAQTTSGEIVAANERAAASFGTLAGAATAADGVIARAASSMTDILGGLGGAFAIVGAGVWDVKNAIQNPSSIGKGGLLDTIFGSGTQATNNNSMITTEGYTKGFGKGNGKNYSLTQGQYNDIDNDKGLNAEQFDSFLSQFSSADKSGSKQAITNLVNELKENGKNNLDASKAFTNLFNNPKSAATAVGKGKDAFIAPPSTAAKKKTGSSTKLDAAELALQVTGTAALNAMLTATHSKSLAALNVALNATHLAATKTLVARLDATHKSALVALGARLLTDQHNEEVARTAILTSDAKSGTSALNSQLSLVTSTSLSTLTTDLNATHNKALTQLETKLDATHNKNLISLAAQLVAVHKQAMDNLVAQTLAAQAAANAKASGGQAAVIAAQETVNEDLLNNKFVNAGTPDAAVAAAQLALDQQKLTDAQQSAALQNQLAAATTTAAQTAAQTAIDMQTAQSTISEANLQAALSWASNVASISDAAQNAAAALAPAADAITAAIAPVVDLNTIGAMLPVPQAPITSSITVTITTATSSSAEEIAAEVDNAISKNNNNLINLIAARG